MNAAKRSESAGMILLVQMCIDAVRCGDVGVANPSGHLVDVHPCGETGNRQCSNLANSCLRRSLCWGIQHVW